MQRKRVLILAPHTDDGEFGCGGTVAKFLEDGADVFYVAFSSAEKSVPSHLPKDILKREVKEAVKTLGIPLKNLILLDYEVRDFPKYRQEILEDMFQLNKKIKPDIILLPSVHDTHQDHGVIAEEGFRVFKRSTMLGYEVPWNNLSFDTTCFVHLEQRHIARKIKALKCYKSQSQRNYASAEFIKGLAFTRGVQIGTKYAETFEVIRWVMP
jgi:N-acetylglucosamine malate deacetylase 1